MPITVKGRSVGKVAVIGSGNIGPDIALHFAQNRAAEGVKVGVVDVVQKALEGVSSLVLENHLNTCVTTAIRGNDVDERQRMIGEIVGVFQETGKL